MPAKKKTANSKQKTVKKTVDDNRKVEDNSTFGLDLSSPRRYFNQTVDNIKARNISRRTLLILLGLGILGLLYLNRGWFIAATVNGQPITTLEVNQQMSKLYKSQIVTQLVNEALIQQEAAKKGITISDDQVNQKLQEAENSYGGKEVFEMLLSQQGITKEEFIKQTRLQLLVETMYASEIAPKEEEIKKFLEDNKDDPEATDEAKFRATAENTLRQQNLAKVFSEKFQEIKKNANIQIF